MSVKTVYTCDGCPAQREDVALTMSLGCEGVVIVPDPWIAVHGRVKVPTGTHLIGGGDTHISTRHYCPDCWERMTAALEKVEA